jgi:hypothetical protein
MSADSYETSSERASSKQTIADAFASGLTESISAPLSGAAELLGGPKREPKAHQASDSGANNTANQAGHMLGSALLFVATTAGVRRLFPGAGKLAPISAGGILGGVAETESGTLTERLQNAAIGAGTVSMLEFAPLGLSRLGIRGQYGQTAISGGLAGTFHVQADSLLKHGQTASLADTVMSGGLWAGTGVAFTAGGKLLSNRRGEQQTRTPLTQEELLAGRQRAQAELDRHFTQLPGLEVGRTATANNRITVGATSEMAKMYNAARESIGRAEVLAYTPHGLEGRFGTVFSISKDGRLMTANHVVKDAVDITIFDRNMRTHRARVISGSDGTDLAVIQLVDKASYGAFKPLPLGSGSAEGIHSAFGHPNGWRDLFAAPGRPKNSPFARAIEQRYEMQAIEGFSGAPIIADGAVQAVYVQGARSNHLEAIGRPIKYGENLLSTLKIEPAANAPHYALPRPKLDLRLIRTFNVGDQNAGLANLEKLFGKGFGQDRPQDFFHSKVKTVQMPGTTSGDLTMKMQFLPAEQQIVIRPIALDGKPISSEMTWPNSQLRVASSKLEVRLGPDGKPHTMVSYDDPALILQKGFDYRGENNYLTTLQQRTVPKWMQLLPPHLRFERLMRTGSGS